ETCIPPILWAGGYNPEHLIIFINVIPVITVEGPSTQDELTAVPMTYKRNNHTQHIARARSGALSASPIPGEAQACPRRFFQQNGVFSRAGLLSISLAVYKKALA
ncbi:hypothetical protein KUCAC02_023362, partial [Chaenocephalus aceratus]